MSAPRIHAKRPVFSASNVRDTIADTLARIKADDELTFADMGRVLGKSGDRAEAYCHGDFTDFPAFAFMAAWREWNGRFIGPLRSLVEESRPGKVDDRECESTVLKAVLALSVALADGKGISAEEVRQNRATLENARDAIDTQLAKLRPAA